MTLPFEKQIYGVEFSTQAGHTVFFSWIIVGDGIMIMGVPLFFSDLWQLSMDILFFLTFKKWGCET